MITWQGVLLGWFLGTVTFLGMAAWVTVQANQRAGKKDAG